MRDRKSLVPTVWISSTLALLASVLAAPILSAGFSALVVRPTCLRRNFALPCTESPARLALSATAASAPPATELSSAIEREERDPLDLPRSFRTSFVLERPSGDVSPFHRSDPLPACSTYPLRC